MREPGTGVRLFAKAIAQNWLFALVFGVTASVVFYLKHTASFGFEPLGMYGTLMWTVGMWWLIDSKWFKARQERLNRWLDERKDARRERRILAVFERRARQEGMDPWVVEWWCVPGKSDSRGPRWVLHGHHVRLTLPGLPLGEALAHAREGVRLSIAATMDIRGVPWRVRNLLTGQTVVCL